MPVSTATGAAKAFDITEADRIKHAEHGDQHGTDPTWRRARDT
jgi:hypothetical protein